VIAVPEITVFKLLDNYHDFIMIASDGVFDRMSTEETIASAWSMDTIDLKSANINELSG
jgi:serine/threonine protein phosphatase PrpC